MSFIMACVYRTLYLPLLHHPPPSPGASRGEIVILAEEVQDSKYTIAMQLSASHLDKKDFFGKVHEDCKSRVLSMYHDVVVVYTHVYACEPITFE